MYTTEIKARRSQAMMKLSINSNKSLNNIQPQKVTSTKIKNIENQFRVPPPISKCNLRKPKSVVLESSQLRKQHSSAAFFSGKSHPITKRDTRRKDDVKKSNIPKSAAKTMAVNKIVLIENSFSKNRAAKCRNQSPANIKFKSDVLITSPSKTFDASVQTNEDEILNHLLIVGDFKVITPSKSISDEIDRLRKETETKNVLTSAHKLEDHTLKGEQHLDDLKEFLDKNFITRKLPKLQDNIVEEDRKIMESMDELLQRGKPKVESITDIRNRIKKKEQELLSIFDKFQKTKECFDKTKV